MNLISQRYAADGIPEWEMNAVRIKYRDLLLEKLKTGVYRTAKVEECLCGGRELEVIAEKDRFGLPFGNAICRSCGLIATSPRLAHESLPAFYTNDYHPLVFGFEQVQEMEYLVNKNQGHFIFNYLKKHLPQKSALKVAEIGTGPGHNLRIFREEAAKIGISVETFGCEFSEDCVEYGKNELGLNLVVGGTEALTDFGVQFDIVIMSHVLEHFVQPEAELEKLAPLLTEDGFLYIEVPGVLEIHHKPEYQCDYLKYSVFAHMFNFSLGTLTNILNRKGFGLVEGNEFVRGIFVKEGEISSVHLNFYNKIISYLKMLDCNRLLFAEFCQIQSRFNKLEGLISQNSEKFGALQVTFQEEKLEFQRTIRQLSNEKEELRERLDSVRRKNNSTDREVDDLLQRIKKSKDRSAR